MKTWIADNVPMFLLVIIGIVAFPATLALLLIWWCWNNDSEAKAIKKRMG